MTQQTGTACRSASEFAACMIGVPWRNRACTYDACDCWGLVVLFYRHVQGREIHHSSGYEADSDFITCFADEVIHWRSVAGPEEGGIFIAYEGDRPAHIGVIVDGRAFHSRGENGAVRSDRMAAIERMFTRVEYKVYAAD